MCNPLYLKAIHFSSQFKKRYSRLLYIFLPNISDSSLTPNCEYSILDMKWIGEATMSASDLRCTESLPNNDQRKGRSNSLLRLFFVPIFAQTIPLKNVYFSLFLRFLTNDWRYRGRGAQQQMWIFQFSPKASSRVALWFCIHEDIRPNYQANPSNYPTIPP